MYRELTDDIEVAVQPEYLEDQSDPEEHRFIWAYTVVIANHSNETVQLESRYWHITNGIGQVEEVSGPGVVGEQPVLDPGETYQYTSGCPLNTPSGTMVGHYVMRKKDGGTFEVRIPPFSLDLPDQTRIIH